MNIKEKLTSRAIAQMDTQTKEKSILADATTRMMVDMKGELYIMELKRNHWRVAFLVLAWLDFTNVFIIPLVKSLS